MELKPFEVIMKIDFGANDGVTAVAHAEKVAELVRCKDCVFAQGHFTNTPVICGCGNGTHHEEYFCADGERKKA